MQVAARSARLEDLDIVSALCTAAIEELRPNRGGDVWSRHEARTMPVDESVSADFHDPDRLLAVGTIDETIVGYAAAHTEALHDGASLASLTDLYVLPGARSVGVGEALMEAVLDWARTRGCEGIDSLALPGDRHTKNFFETFGLVARALRVHRAL